MASLFGFNSCSCRLKVFCKIGGLKNFAKFTGKHLYGSLFFNKVAPWKPAALSKRKKKKTPMHVFSSEFHETYKNTYSVEHLSTAASVSSGSMLEACFVKKLVTFLSLTKAKMCLYCLVLGWMLVNLVKPALL